MKSPCLPAMKSKKHRSKNYSSGKFCEIEWTGEDGPTLIIHSREFSALVFTERFMICRKMCRLCKTEHANGSWWNHEGSKLFSLCPSNYLLCFLNIWMLSYKLWLWHKFKYPMPFLKRSWRRKPFTPTLTLLWGWGGKERLKGMLINTRLRKYIGCSIKNILLNLIPKSMSYYNWGNSNKRDFAKGRNDECQVPSFTNFLQSMQMQIQMKKQWTDFGQLLCTILSLFTHFISLNLQPYLHVST